MGGMGGAPVYVCDQPTFFWRHYACALACACVLGWFSIVNDRLAVLGIASDSRRRRVIVAALSEHRAPRHFGIGGELGPGAAHHKHRHCRAWALAFVGSVLLKKFVKRKKVAFLVPCIVEWCLE